MSRIILFLCLFVPISSFAEGLATFNQDSRETIEGEILSINSYKYVTHPSPHTQILLRTEIGDITVDLGSQWYLKEQGVILLPMDKIEVTGSVHQMNGKKVLIAIKIKTNGQEIKLSN